MADVMDVQLYVYDLSQGLARQLSRQFLGTQIDAVYHTSLVFGGVEYFFGAGVQTCYPGSTHHGRPMEIIPLGQTSLPLDIILEYLESLQETYTAASYDLFSKNCNNFTHDFAMFLVGRGIPHHITSLPKTVLDTPFGQMLRPQIDRAMRPVTQASIPPQPVRPHHAAKQTSMTNGVHPSPSTVESTKVHNVTTPRHLSELLNHASSSCAIIFFTSATCPPCRTLYPLYDSLSTSSDKRATFIKIDVGAAPALASDHSITATPTFITFLKGQREDSWTGASVAQLRGNVALLLQSAFPPHPHSALKLPTFHRQPLRPVLYAKMPPLDKLSAKMGAASADPAAREAIDFLQRRSRSLGHAKGSQEHDAVPDLAALGAFLRTSLHSLPLEARFTAYDLLRLLLLDARISGFFASEPAVSATTLPLLEHVSEMQNGTGGKCPYSLRLCAAHVGCNLFASPLMVDSALKKKKSSDGFAKAVVALACAALLEDQHAALRASGANLALNLATAVMGARTGPDGGTQPLGENLQVELVAALVEALASRSASTETETEIETKTEKEREAERKEKETNAIATKTMALALGRLAYCAPVDGEVLGLCRVMEAGRVVVGGAGKEEKKEDGGDGGRELLREVGVVLGGGG